MKDEIKKESVDKQQPTMKGKSKRKRKHANPVIELLLSPTYWPVALFECVVAWFFTRRWVPLVALSPLAVGVCFLLYVVQQGGRKSPLRIAAHYVALSEKAEADGNDEMLDICYRRLLATQLEESTRFKVAKFLLTRGRVAEARDQFRILAPEDRAGYGPAHLWVVSDIFASASATFRPKLQRIRHHITSALKSMPEDPEVLWLAAQLALKEEAPKEALNYLELAAKQKPQFLLAAAELHAKMGNTTNFELFANRANTHFTEALAKDSKNVPARFSLIQAKLLLRQIQEAIQLAEEGFRLEPTEDLRKILVGAHLSAFDHKVQQSRDFSGAVVSLERILAIEPNNVQALERFARIAAEGDEAKWPSLKKRLEEALADGTATPIIHFILSNGHLNRQESELAKVHLEQAYAQNPRILEVLNNLAWLEAHQEKPDLERALQLVDQAISIAPNHPEVQETRGTILVKSKKYVEAIACIEPLLKVFPDREKIRTMLAESYEALGDSSLAERYRKQAEEIASRNKGKNSK